MNETHHFAKSRRTLDGVPQLDKGLSFLVILLLDVAQLGVQIDDVATKVLDHAQTLVEVTETHKLSMRECSSCRI
jgi:hypothetical protein